MGFRDFILEGEDKCRCVHCKTIVDSGILNLIEHLGDCEVIKRREEARTKKMLDNFNNYKNEKK